MTPQERKNFESIRDNVHGEPMTQVETMKLALEFVEDVYAGEWHGTILRREQVSKALRQAIEQAQKQEPVAMQMDVIVVNLVREGINKHRARELAEHFIKHTSPPQRQWVGLTDLDLQEIIGTSVTMGEFIKNTEAKLKEKNT